MEIEVVFTESEIIIRYYLLENSTVLKLCNHKYVYPLYIYIYSILFL